MKELNDVRNNKILISCINWGKGHVARSIGLIQQLVNQDNEIVIAGNEEQLSIFRCYFPNLNYVQLDGYPFSFSGNGNFSADLWKSRKAILDFVQFERKWLEDFLTKNEFKLIISDHRYGFYSSSVKSIFLTHQLNLALKWWQFPAQFLHRRMIRKFNEIWILDTKDSALAGKLSRNSNFKNAQYIGHFSRFMLIKKDQEKSISNLVICNGPMPYDEQMLLKYLDRTDVTIIAPSQLCEKYPNKNLIASDDWLKCDEIIHSAKKIYAYCGYSTLMDLKFLNCEAELTPTKGQSEQEYLAELHGLTERKS